MSYLVLAAVVAGVVSVEIDLDRTSCWPTWSERYILVIIRIQVVEYLIHDRGSNFNDGSPSISGSGPINLFGSPD